MEFQKLVDNQGQFSITHTGNVNPVKVKLPMWNGRPISTASVQVQKMDVTTGNPQQISVVNVLIDRVSDLYGVNGQKHGLVLSIHRLIPGSAFEYQSDMGNVWGIGSNPDMFELKILDQTGKMVQLGPSDTWSFQLMVYVK